MKLFPYLVISIILFTGCAAPKDSNETKNVKPNILLINIDDMGWRDVSFMGSEFFETPNIDSLAKNGMILTNAYASAANCAPSRACLMSGQWTPRHGIYTVKNSDRGESRTRKLIPTTNNEIIPENNLLLSQVLNEAGYITCHAGKWHLSDDPLQNGFDVNIGGCHAGNPGSYYPPYKNVPLDAPSEDYYLTDLVMDLTLEFIDSVGKQPFFLYYSPYAVHGPYQPKIDLMPKYRSKTPWNGQESAEYGTMVENLDIQIGRLINRLNILNKLENTLILFTTDNGGPYFITKQWPLRAGKGSYYEGGIRVPTFAYWEGKIPGGKTSDVPFAQIDIYPTLLKAAGITKPEGKVLDGENMLAFLTEGEIQEERSLFWHFPIYLQGGNSETQDSLFRTRPGSAIRNGNWKLIQYFENNDIELYNLAEDIGETKNLADKNPEKVTELLEKLEKWREETNAPVPSEVNPEFSNEK